MTTKTQKHLPFDVDREAERQERVERICQLDPRIGTAARFFTQAEHRKAEKLATTPPHQSHEDAF